MLYLYNDIIGVDNIYAIQSRTLNCGHLPMLASIGRSVSFFISCILWTHHELLNLLLIHKHF